MVKNFNNNFNIIEYLKLCHFHFYCQYEDITELIIWSITHMISESQTVKEIVVKSDIIKDVLKLSKKESNSCGIIRIYSWFYLSLFKIKNYLPDYKYVEDIIKSCVNLVYIKDNEIVINAIWVFDYISEYEYPNIEEVILNSGAIVKILSFIPTFNAFQLPIVILIGNMLYSSQEVTNVYICNVVSYGSKYNRVSL